MPVPASLDKLIGDRISRLPRRTRDALALTAALGSPREALLRRAGVSADILRPALRAHVVEHDGDTIRFTHPLLSSVAYPGPGEQGRAVHALAVGLAGDPLARARHLAFSKAEPDARVARSLDAAASLATERGAMTLAAELAEQAVRLTPPRAGANRHRRTLAAARAQLAAGEWTRAGSIATALLTELDKGPWRAEALVLLAEIEVDDLALPLLEEALADADGRPDLQSRIHSRLAAARRFQRGFSDARADGRIALAIADELDDDELRFEALAVLTWLGVIVGAKELPDEAARMREIADKLGDQSMLKHVDELATRLLVNAGRLDDARAGYEAAIERWCDRDEVFTSVLKWSLAWVELWSGRWEVAADLAEEARDISLQYGLEKNQDYIPTAWVALYRGQFELACAEADRGLELCEEQIGLDPPLLRAVRGIAALWSGDPGQAAKLLARADEQAERLGWGDPTQRPWTSEYVEALLALGRLDDATSVLDRWDADATKLGRPRVAAHVTRCRGLAPLQEELSTRRPSCWRRRPWATWQAATLSAARGPC